MPATLRSALDKFVLSSAGAAGGPVGTAIGGEIVDFVPKIPGYIGALYQSIFGSANHLPKGEVYFEGKLYTGKAWARLVTGRLMKAQRKVKFTDVTNGRVRKPRRRGRTYVKRRRYKRRRPYKRRYRRRYTRRRIRRY